MTDLEKLEEVLKDPRIKNIEFNHDLNRFVVWYWFEGMGVKIDHGMAAGSTLAEALKSVRIELGLEKENG